MHWLHTVSNWATGGGHYMPLYGCMHRDTLWVTITVVLDLAVAGGYTLIAYHWWLNQRTLPVSPARSALGTMRNIFLLCGICSYVFLPIKMVWPAWRLYDIVLAVLVFYTWRYALSAKNLKVIYTAIGRSNQLAADLADAKEDSKRKSFFLNAISHDLRTPLNGLMLQANLAELQIQDGDTASARTAIAEIQSAARLTADLLEGLLDYARMESDGDHAVNGPVNLDQLLQDVLNIHASAAAAKNLRYTSRINTGISLVSDRLRLERILNNLLSNAIKFTPAGAVTLHVDRGVDGVEIHVIDTGVGVAQADKEHLFDEFFQANNDERDRRKGFGLGLAICQRLARQIDAELRLESEVGRGSRFTLVVPYGPKPMERAGPVVVESTESPAAEFAAAASRALG